MPGAILEIGRARRIAAGLFFLGLAPASFAALGEDPGIDFAPVAGDFRLAAAGGLAPICAAPGDWPGVLRAAGDLRADVARVTGGRPDLDLSVPSKAPEAVLVGTLGRSPLIDGLVRSGKLDASAISGKWESFLSEVVENPLPGVSRALVIAGSDKRGTIYGIYDLSERIGVSPWTWWDDVPVVHRDRVYVRPGVRRVGPPAVKYRGIFLNDEAPALTGWVKEKYGDYNHEFYARIFELLLRLRANYLWPAMWDNCFYVDDPENAKLADLYGIVMGTSHVEPMMRADREWYLDGHTAADWNFLTHRDDLLRFWTQGIVRSRPYENVITIGMRGKTDSPMSPSPDLPLLEEIVAAQRRIIAAQINPDVTRVPQVWCLYKEVQDYYDRGMRVPDDVTLLWSDDNWGNIRRLPTPAERRRSGGAGIYYHLDYVGGPRSYRWLDTVPIPKIWEQMHLAWRYGADRIWIVNVGPLKGKEVPMEFFLRYAWDPSAWPASRLPEYARDWAAREFGPEHAAEIGRVVSLCAKYNGRRKPELLSPDTYSLADYDEAARVCSDWNALAREALRLDGELPAADHAAFFQLVLYPVLACANLTDMYVAVGRNHLYAKEGLPEAGRMADLARALFARDAELTRAYDTLEGGRWDRSIDQPHIGYTSWRSPVRNVMPALAEVSHAPLPPPPPPPAVPAGVAPPPSFSGFVETGGVVSIEAEHTARRVGTDGIRWLVIPDFGRTLSGVTSCPVTADSALPRPAGPRLEYSVWLRSPGAVAVHLIVAPTLNFVPGRGLRAAVSLDGGPPQAVDFLADRSNRAWSRSVEDGVRTAVVPLAVTRAGAHVLKFWRVDPGVVLEKIVIDAGGLRPSYLGPPESPRMPDGAAAAIPSSARPGGPA